MLGDKGLLDALKSVNAMAPALHDMTEQMRLMRATLEQTIAAMELVSERLLEVQEEMRSSMATATRMRDDVLARLDD